MVRQFLEGQNFFKAEFGQYCKEVSLEQPVKQLSSHSEGILTLSFYIMPLSYRHFHNESLLLSGSYLHLSVLLFPHSSGYLIHLATLHSSLR